MILLVYCLFTLNFLTTSSQSIFNGSSFTSYQYYGWSGNTYYCDDNIDCVLNCYTFNACDGITIIGPANAKLTVNCNSNYLAPTSNEASSACQWFDIHAEDSAILEINVYNAYAELWAVNIYTPTTPELNTFITCGIVGPYNVNEYRQWSCTRQSQVYSVYGWETVEWTYANNASWSLSDVNPSWPQTMHCGTDYLQSCTGFAVDQRYYRCEDDTSVCDFDRGALGACAVTDNETDPFILFPGDVLYSDDMNVRLNMQEDDGNLCLYTFDGSSWTVRFCSYALGIGNYAIIDITGNLVVYNVNDAAVWRAINDTSILPPYEPVTLCVDDCGKAFLYDIAGTPLWESPYNVNGPSLGYPINDCLNAVPTPEPTTAQPTTAQPTTPQPTTRQPTPSPIITGSSFTNDYEYYGWYLDTFYCTDGIDCVLNCYITDACDSVTIIGPANAKLTVNCNSNYVVPPNLNKGSGACQFMEIHAESSTQLEINVYNAYAELWGNNIYTPTTPELNTFITSGIIGPNTYNGSIPRVPWPYNVNGNKLYSVYGWETVEWTYYENSIWSLNNTDPNWPQEMHCSTDYLQSCTFAVDGRYYRCEDETSVCDFDRGQQTYYGCVRTEDAADPFILYQGDVLYSDDMNVRLNMQDDGNLCLYTFDGSIWIDRFCTFQFGVADYAVVDITGNLIVYDVNGIEIWKAINETSILPPYEPVTLCVDDCGKAFLYDIDGIPFWEMTYNQNPTVPGYPINECSNATVPPTVCEKNVNYVIDGQVCHVWGDPHFIIFNGAVHDFQGQPDTGKSQFYYVKPCADASTDDMPFTILAKHQRWEYRTVTGIDYITLELFDNDGTVYLLFLSSSIAGYMDESNAINTLYDDNMASVTSITADVETTIGNRFKIEYTQTSYKRIDVVVTIDDECTVELYMEGQTYFDGRWRMHILVITPPECYRCFICGLCGDFKRQRINDIYGNQKDPQQLETCDGGFVEYYQGWDESNTFAYDINGNTWEQSYCSPNRRRMRGRRRLQIGDEYTPEIGDSFTFVEPCDSSIEQQVITSCQTAREDASSCCDILGSKYCDGLQISCEVDACAASGTNVSAIDKNVAEVFTTTIDLLCSLPDVQQLFNPNNTIATTVIDDFIFPTDAPEVISTTMNVETTPMDIDVYSGDVCNDGRASDAKFEEIGYDNVGYCYDSTDDNGYPIYIASTTSGDARMYYSADIEQEDDGGIILSGDITTSTTSGYVIYHEDQIVAYCVGQTNPTNCDGMWYAQNWDGDFVVDQSMTTSECDCVGTDEGDGVNQVSVIFGVIGGAVLALLES